jgi:hypothetical protein
VQGDIAEVGTSRGGSARLIGEYSSGKTIHVFDTFEGLPEPGPQDPRFSKGEYSCSLGKVQEYLKGLPVEFHKGIFPHSSTNVRNRRFSFVHLDVDLYQSTLDCLNFFYPRLSLGGIIISHDYTTAEGVDLAFDEFFSDKTSCALGRTTKDERSRVDINLLLSAGVPPLFIAARDTHGTHRISSDGR